MATFTIDSFNHWQWAANSVYYLLSLWSRLVASMPYLKGDVPSQLESFVPQVITLGSLVITPMFPGYHPPSPRRAAGHHLLHQLAHGTGACPAV